MLSIGTTETITSDLSKVGSIIPLDRSKIEEICKEISLGQSGLLDETSAQKAGKLLGAKYVIIGSWQKFDSYRLIARMVEVESGKIVATSKQTGLKENIFDIQDFITEDLFSQVNIQLTAIEKNDIRVKETQSINAYESYSLAKKAQYANNDQMAKFYAKEALSYDPSYQKAKTLIGKYGELIVSFDDKFGNAIDEGGAKGLGKAWLAQAAGTILIWIPCLATLAICVVVGAPDWITGVVFGGTLLATCAIYVTAKKKKDKSKRISLQLPSCHPFLCAEYSAHAFAYHQQLQKDNPIKISATLFRLYF